MPEGTSKVLEVMAADAEFDTVGAYCRAIIEREIGTVKPEDFKRLRGVG
jgi:hypothetical protein